VDFQKKFNQDDVKVISQKKIPNSDFFKKIRNEHDYVYLSTDFDVLGDKSSEDKTEYKIIPIGQKKIMLPISSDPIINTPPKEVIRVITKLDPDTIDVYKDDDQYHYVYKKNYVKGLAKKFVRNPTQEDLEKLNDFIPLLYPQNYYIEWAYEAYKRGSFTIPFNYNQVFEVFRDVKLSRRFLKCIKRMSKK
jgi:hypothetical protein